VQPGEPRTRKSTMISLDRISAITAKPAPSNYVEVGGRRPRASRHAVYKQGVAILSHGERVPVVIRNLSPKGCRIEYFQNRILEGRVLLEEPSISLRRWAEIVWHENGVSGLSFIDPDVK
jgi:hypothetical protein